MCKYGSVVCDKYIVNINRSTVVVRFIPRNSYKLVKDFCSWYNRLTWYLRRYYSNWVRELTPALNVQCAYNEFIRNSRANELSLFKLVQQVFVVSLAHQVTVWQIRVVDSPLQIIGNYRRAACVLRIRIDCVPKNLKLGFACIIASVR